MTLVKIFEHILDGFEFDELKIDNILKKAENAIETCVDKTLDTINKF